MFMAQYTQTPDITQQEDAKDTLTAQNVCIYSNPFHHPFQTYRLLLGDFCSHSFLCLEGIDSRPVEGSVNHLYEAEAILSLHVEEMVTLNTDVDEGSASPFCGENGSISSQEGIWIYIDP